MGIGTWLAAMMSTLTARVLLALGFQVVTITGAVVAFDQVKTLFINSMAAVPAAGLQLALLAGVGPAFGMILGAIAFRIALWQIQNSVRILGVNNA